MYATQPGTGSTSLAEEKAAVLDVHSVQVRYGENLVLDSLTLNVHRGEIYALLGANGAGKTTTLNVLLGFVKPSAGSVRIDGVDPVSHPDQARQHVAYIPENVSLYGHLSARENIAYFLDLAEQSEDDQLITCALDTAGLDRAMHDRRVGRFSKGMRQKVAIALALAREVPVLLLDEPASGLDPRATAELNSLLSQLREQHVAVLMVTHDLLSAADIADRVGFLDAGRLVEEVAANGSERFDVRALHRRFAGQTA
ncbi:MAG: ABC transporter ATP-binding protein [Pseudomonas sp.]